MAEINSNLSGHATLLGPQVERIKGIKEISQSDGEEISDVLKILKIKKKGTFRITVLEGNLPVFELSPLQKIKMPLGVELTTKHIEELLSFIDKLEKTAFFKDLGDWFKALRINETLESIGNWFKHLWEKTLIFLKKAWRAIVRAALVVVEFFKNLFSKDKDKKPSEEEIDEFPLEEKQEEKDEIQEFPDAAKIPEPPN